MRSDCPKTRLGGQEVPFVTEGDESDRELGAYVSLDEGCRHGDGVLVGALLQLSCLNGAVEIDEDPYLTGATEVEFLGHELAHPGGAVPVNAAEGVAGGVVPHGRGVGRHAL